ncbi:VOC family protein [Bacillus cereus]|uniref:VOC family protein n=1 Tax=Bacillus cereus TaxID=1396 RepID=UPI000BEE3E8A|nr:VOC family protein [Bacillus cereus]PEF61857.1 glyoxalase [Bacillus cereus]
MKIQGIGGIFLRIQDVPTLKGWYKETLGISMENWNGIIMTPSSDNQTIFSFFEETSTYFPTEQSVMLNFQVENITAWMEHFDRLGIPLLKNPEKNEYGTFVWISDPEGRWIELWEK